MTELELKRYHVDSIAQYKVLIKHLHRIVLRAIF